MKHVLWIWITMLLILSLFGCTSRSKEQNLEQQIASTLAATFVMTEPTKPLPVTVRGIPATTTSHTNTPRPSPTVTATELPTNTPTPDALATTIVEQRCSLSEPVQAKQTDLAQGLVFVENGQGDRAIRVLGSAGLQEPVWSYQFPDNSTFSIISPNGNWIAFMTYSAVDRDSEIYSITMRVTNWNEDQEFRVQFNDLTLSRFADIRWINDSHIVFPLANEDELFHWLVWSPFSAGDDTELLSVELPDITERQRFLEYAYPGPDPLLELVVYPCADCAEAEYAAKRLLTGETAWFIDIGSNPNYDYRSYAYWSPDGQYVTVIGGEFLNQLLFFNREGDKLYEITLSLLDDPGSLMIFNWAWSPDSKYLAFLRVTGTEDHYEDTLTFIDLQTGQVVDLCINARTGFPIWSPDSEKIAFSRQIQSGEQSRLISIVDIYSGDVLQLHDAKAYNLVDWIDLPDDK